MTTSRERPSGDQSTSRPLTTSSGSPPSAGTIITTLLRSAHDRTKAIREPSGDHDGWMSVHASGGTVSWRRPPVSAPTWIPGGFRVARRPREPFAVGGPGRVGRVEVLGDREPLRSGTVRADDVDRPLALRDPDVESDPAPIGGEVPGGAVEIRLVRQSNLLRPVRRHGHQVGGAVLHVAQERDAAGRLRTRRHLGGGRRLVQAERPVQAVACARRRRQDHHRHRQGLDPSRSRQPALALGDPSSGLRSGRPGVPATRGSRRRRSSKLGTIRHPLRLAQGATQRGPCTMELGLHGSLGHAHPLGALPHR